MKTTTDFSIPLVTGRAPDGRRVDLRQQRLNFAVVISDLVPDQTEITYAPRLDAALRMYFAIVQPRAAQPRN